MRMGFRGWCVTPADVLGCPDFVFREEKVAIFVDGCFWHGCKRHLRMPASNAAYWQAKIERNRKRDRQVSRALRQQGWRVIRVWEHTLTCPGPLKRWLNYLALTVGGSGA